MSLVVRSFFLALADLFRPRMWGFMLAPLLALGLLVGGLSWWLWDRANGGLVQWLSALPWVDAVQTRITTWFGSATWLGEMTVALVGVAFAMFLLLLAMLCAVVLASAVLAPLVADDVAKRRFAQLARIGDASFWVALWWSLRALGRAVLLMVLSLPLWLVPVLHLLAPPLIWGWLNSRVMGFDVLANFATRAEMAQLLHAHRRPLFVMGLATSLLGAAPALAWLSGIWFAALFFVLMPVAALIYMAVLVFTALWFAHFALAALQAQRSLVGGAITPSVASMDVK